MSKHPVVFLSHASEDKDRFVVPFATELRARGLDVWLDQWEMLPGDSLVKKIFTEGLDRAGAVIVVVSSISVTKRWVAEELDAAVVQRIERDTRLIPVVLDGLAPGDLPPAIRHLLHVAVQDTSDRVAAIEQTVRAIAGAPDKPPLGDLPNYAVASAAAVPGLDRIDTLILGSIGAEAIRDFGDHFQTTDFVASVTAELGISEDQAVESLEVLDADGFIELHRTLGSGIESMSSFGLRWFGLETYASAFLDDFESMVGSIVAALANWSSEQGSDTELADRTDVPRLLVLHVLETLENRGLLRLSKSMGPSTHFLAISPKLRRLVP